MADDTGKTTRTKQGTADIVTALRDHINGPHIDHDICLRCWAADEIERLRNHTNSYRLDLHATLIALNDLVAIPTDPQHHHHAQQTLRRIREQRRININAIRPTRGHTYGT